VDDPAASGAIEISFLITPEGSVTDVAVVSDETLASLNNLVEESILSLSFAECPEQEGDIPITVPLNLIPPQ